MTTVTQPPGPPNPPPIESAGPDLYPCNWCEQPIEGRPVTDPDHVAIFGFDRAVKFCTEDHLAAYAEANSLNK